MNVRDTRSYSVRFDEFAIGAVRDFHSKKNFLGG